MTPPVTCGEPIDVPAFAALRRRTIFECCKWDPQVGDVAALSNTPLLLAPEAWAEIAHQAEALARELRDAEDELTGRPDLWRELGLPWSVRRALARVRRAGAPRALARLVRFDFHPTRDGWRISEANTDVPGGFVEAQGFTSLVAEHIANSRSDCLGAGSAAPRPAGAPAAAYADAIRRALPDAALVALVHATAYADDRQVMVYLARELERRGLRAVLISPEHLRWERGGASGAATGRARARLACDWADGEPAAVLRFFPAEWLPNCSRASGWRHFFAGAETPLSNPATAILTQGKRLPLVWDRLRTPLPTWRALLPETRSAAELTGAPGADWVLKPALGRVGDGVGIEGVTPDKERAQIVQAARRSPRHWVLQRRFESAPVPSAGGPVHVCLGVFTVDSAAAGVYGRISSRALIDQHAQDAAVLVTAPRPAFAQEVLA